MTIAEPVNTIISREHSVKHEILKVGQVLSGEEVCFVHTSMMARIGGIFNPPCATLGSGTLLSQIHDPGKFFNRLTGLIQNLVKFHVDVATIVKNLKHRGQVCIRQGLTAFPELQSHRVDCFDSYRIQENRPESTESGRFNQLSTLATQEVSKHHKIIFLHFGSERVLGHPLRSRYRKNLK